MDATDAKSDAGGAEALSGEVEAYSFEMEPQFPQRVVMRLAFRDGRTASVRMSPGMLHRMSGDALRAIAALHGVRVGAHAEPET